jgi:hypothetical protein
VSTTQPVRLTWRALPEHVLVLATALAVDGERRPMHVIELLRGLVVQMVYRTLCGEVLVVPGRAVLLWSVVHRGPVHVAERVRSGVRRTWAAVVATLVGSVLNLLSLGGVLVLIGLVLHATGVSPAEAKFVPLALGTASMGVTGWRAIGAYRVEHHRQAYMAGLNDSPTWRLDLLGAPDARQGYGGLLLDAFVKQADAAHAQVFLLTQPENHDFYRRHGLRVQPSEGLDGMLLMRRSLRPVREAHAA